MNGVVVVNSWRDYALCVEVDPELFFPDAQHSSENRQARKLCFECPVREECLGYALVNRIDYGIWGGCTPLERKLLRRKLKK